MGAGSGGGQGGHRPPRFLDWGGTGGTKKWYQHLQVISANERRGNFFFGPTI